MARSRGTDVFRVSVRGAGKVAAEFDHGARQVQDEIIAALRRLGEQARLVFAEEAPRDTGDTIEAMQTVFSFRAIRPTMSLRIKPLRGHRGRSRDYFNYLRVPRFGHRTGIIRVRRGKALKVHIEGHRNPHAVIFRAAVRGVGHPPIGALRAARAEGGQEAVNAVRGAYRVRDWVQSASERLTPVIDREAAELGRRIDRKVLR